MDHLTDLAQQATTERERAAFRAEQRRLWLSIKPFATGAMAYVEAGR